MRTTSLEDHLAKQVRRRAEAEGLSASAFIAKTLNDALEVQRPPEVQPFRLITVGGGGPLPGVDLDRPRSLEAAEDEAVYAPPATRGKRARQASRR
jgi:hypothetical protein